MATVASSKRLTLWFFGFGFIWAYAFSLLLPFSTQETDSPVDEINFVRLAVVFGFSVAFLCLFLLQNKMTLGYTRKSMRIGVFCLISVSALITEVARSMVFNVWWLTVGAFAAGIALGVLVTLWTELWGTAHPRQVSVGISGSVILGVFLYVLITALSNYSSLFGALIMVVIPWFSFFSLSKGWQTVSSQAPKASAARRSFRNLSAPIGGMIAYSVAYGFMLGFTTEEAISTAGTMTTSLAQILGVSIIALILLVLTSILFSDERKMSLVYRIFLPSLSFSFLLPLLANDDWVLISTAFVAGGLICHYILTNIIFTEIMRITQSSAAKICSAGFGLSGLGLFLGLSAYGVLGATVKSSYFIQSIVLILIVFVLVLMSTVVFSDRAATPLWGLSPITQSVIEDRCKDIADKYRLTPREREILYMLARGKSDAYMQEELNISFDSVRTHTTHIYMKLDIHSRQELFDLIESRSEVGR